MFGKLTLIGLITGYYRTGAARMAGQLSSDLNAVANNLGQVVIAVPGPP
jgi:hypothetical protein